MKNYFDIKCWVKQYFGLTKDDTTLDRTNNSLEFLWVWSIFEAKYLKSDETQSFNEQLVEFSQKYPVEKIHVDEIYSFFYKRYFCNGRITQCFKNLGLKKHWSNKLIQILRKQNPNDFEKLELVLLIIYKFRCNLFHGRKDPLLWKNFDKVFYQINKFLADLLEKRVISSRT